MAAGRKDWPLGASLRTAQARTGSKKAIVAIARRLLGGLIQKQWRAWAHCGCQAAAMHYGEKCFVVMESSNGEVPELAVRDNQRVE